MARSRQPQSNRRTSSAKNSRSTDKRRLRATSSEQGFLDDEAKRNIVGIAVIVLAIILLVASIVPSKAVVTSFVSNALHLTFGIGCYVFPLFLVAIGLSFMIQSEREHVSSRAALGLLLIFLSILTILSLFSPNVATFGPDAVLQKEHVIALGGYAGAGLAWVGLTLFGQVIATIIAVGVLVASLFIIGFSLNDFKNKIERKRQQRIRRREEETTLPEAAFKSKKHLNAEGNTRMLSGVDAFQPLAASESANGKTCRISSSPAGWGSLFEKKKRQGWVDPTLAEFEDGNHDNTSKQAILDKNEKKAHPEAAVGNVLAAAALDAAGDAENVDAASSTRAAKTRVLRKNPSLSDIDASEVAGETKPLTRKLGQKYVDSQQRTENKEPERKKRMKPDESLAVPAPIEGFELPPSDYLKRSEVQVNSNASDEELEETAETLAETLEDFGISIEVKGWVAGPTVTLFKIALPAGVRVNRITVLSDDIALALAAPGVRIFAPIPGTNYVGIEVPNKVRQNVLLGDVLEYAPAGPLQCAVGKDVEGNNVIMDLAKAPHVLIGGTTGSGKSVGINSFIMSMLMRNTPNEVRMILIDPKRVEFSLYNGIPHLYIPVVEDPKDASAALNWGVAEMERRLKLFSSVGARNIAQFNTKVQSGELENENALPFIVIVIDELADLMMNVGKEVEFSISRLAQLARATGIHLIVATQRPSANVVTGLIKSNITTRIAFTVASGIDSRVILDSPGAENLTNNGDLLFSKPDLAKPLRIQGCYVSEDEINDVVEHLKQQGDPDYHSEILQVNTMSLGDTAPDGSGGRGGCDDPLLWEAAEIVVSAGTASTSYIQRRLSVGYSRAGRIMDMLESKGVVGPQNGSKAREVLVDALELETLKAFELND